MHVYLYLLNMHLGIHLLTYFVIENIESILINSTSSS